MTIFIRVLDASVDEKAQALRRATASIRSGQTASSQNLVFDRPAEAFGSVPGSPFAYWVSDDVRSLFSRFPPFGSAQRIARNGLATADDFRWLRLWWEARKPQAGPSLVPLSKGGRVSPFYVDLPWGVRWGEDGRWLKEWKQEQLRLGKITANNSRCWNEPLYRKPGLTWPLRTSKFAPAPMPAGSIFSVRGYSAFVPKRELEATLAVFNSTPFDYLFKVALGRHGHPEFVVGILETMPWPTLGNDSIDRLGCLARRAWSLKRWLDTSIETSHAFLLPPSLNEKVEAHDESTVDRELAEIQAQIDDLAFNLYGISTEDRANIEAPAKQQSSSESDETESTDDADEADDGDVVGDGSEALCSWFVGVAFARFDPRLATGERAIPPEPEPFDPLPSRSPGMYPKGEEPADRPDILVDDEGHADDLAARAQAVAGRCV